MAEVHVNRLEAHLARMRALQAAQDHHRQAQVDQLARDRAEAERVANLEAEGQGADRHGR